MKTIVILGAGIAATPLIRQTMVNVVLKQDEIKLIVVAPNTHFLWPIAMPRVVVPGQFADDKVFFPLESTFKQYPADKFEFVPGKASGLEPAGNTVTISLNDGGSQEVHYDTLIIATGSRTRDSMPWKNLDTTVETKAKIQSLRDQIAKADIIVIGGGGITGVETAGELGFEYAKTGKKQVYLVHDGALPMGAPVLDSVRRAAKDELTRLRVNIIPNTTVVGATASDAGTVLELRAADGTTKTMTAGAYLPATGVVPNTEFAPAMLRDAGGYMKQTSRLQVEGHDNIFVVGDAGSLEGNKMQVAEAQTAHLVKTLPAYLSGSKAAEYSSLEKHMYGITVGRSRGTGQMGTFKMLSFLVWFFKGRSLGTDRVPEWAAGTKLMNVTFEK